MSLTGGDGHLGERVTSLVDGQFGHDARDRALAHVAGCPSCRSALEGERQVKARLAELAAPPVSTRLYERLLAIGVDRSDDPPAPAVAGPGAGVRRSGVRRRSGLPSVARPRAADLPSDHRRPVEGRPADRRPTQRRPGDGRPADRRPVDSRPADRRPGTGSPRRSGRAVGLRRALAGGASLVALGLGVALAVGGPAGGSGVVVDPSVDTFAVDHADMVGDPFTGPAAGTGVSVSYPR